MGREVETEETEEEVEEVGAVDEGGEAFEVKVEGVGAAGRGEGTVERVTVLKCVAAERRKFG